MGFGHACVAASLAAEHGRASTSPAVAAASHRFDPGYAHAHALLGWSYISMFNLDTRRPIGEFTDRALEAGNKAVTLDDQDPWAHLVSGLGHARRAVPSWHYSSVEVRGLEPELRLGMPGSATRWRSGASPSSGWNRSNWRSGSVRAIHFLRSMRRSSGIWRSLRFGRYEETVAVCRSTAEMHPNRVGAGVS